MVRKQVSVLGTGLLKKVQYQPASVEVIFEQCRESETELVSEKLPWIVNAAFASQLQ